MKSKYHKEIHKYKNRILLDLKHLNPYIYHESKNDSIYIKFENENIRTIRLADHRGIEKYKYKWNLHICGIKREEFDNGVKRFYYPVGLYKEFIRHICNYANKVCGDINNG